MQDYQLWVTFGVFIATVVFLMWRPKGINEAVPTSVGALILIIVGVSNYTNIVDIFGIVSGAAVTILSTIVMSIILDSIGFFRWIAYNIIERANGSGIKLYWLTNLLCFSMTIFFNNDGSILITTPIIITICTMLRFKKHQMLPYLLSGALIATASSAPIGVSNLANLIALNLVGLSLNEYTILMFVPSMIGISSIAIMLYLYFRKDIPKALHPHTPPFKLTLSVYHPLQTPPEYNKDVDWWLFRVCISIIVFIRAGFFLAESVGIPMEAVAVVGVILLLGIRYYRTRQGLRDVASKTPWHILLFAFSIYVIVDSLHRAGFTEFIINILKPISQWGDASLIFSSGLLLTLLSNLVNNLPSVMIGTFTVTDLGLSEHQLHLAYLANIIGSDIGSLLTPIGTLATLIWMFILKSHNIRVSWKQYLKVTIVVIPIGLFISLLALYFWTSILG